MLTPQVLHTYSIIFLEELQITIPSYIYIQHILLFFLGVCWISDIGIWQQWLILSFFFWSKSTTWSPVPLPFFFFFFSPPNSKTYSLVPIDYCLDSDQTLHISKSSKKKKKKDSQDLLPKPSEALKGSSRHIYISSKLFKPYFFWNESGREKKKKKVFRGPLTQPSQEERFGKSMKQNTCYWWI